MPTVAQAFVYSAEIVVRHVQGNRRQVIVQLFAEGVGQPGKAPVGHADRKIAALDIERADLLRFAPHRFPRDRNHGRWRVAMEGADAAHANAVIAREQAELARAQIEINKIGIFDLERAYISVGPTQLITNFIPKQQAAFYHPSDPQRITLKLHLHNTGRTAVFLKKVYGQFSRTAPQGDVPIYSRGASKILDVSLAAGADAVLDPIVFSDYFTGPQYFWGYVEYDDIFKQRHTSRVCVQLFPAEVNRGHGKYDIAGSDGWRKDD